MLRRVWGEVVSLSHEKINAMKQCRDLMLELATGYLPFSFKANAESFKRSGFKRVPKSVREACRNVLRHYPFPFDIERYWSEPNSSQASLPSLDRKPATRQPRRRRNVPRKRAI